MSTFSNDDLMERLDVLEGKVDMLCAKMERANGAWFFVKLMASVAVGAAVVWQPIHEWFLK